MTKKKYNLILGISMGLFVLSLVLFCVAFVIKEKAVAGFYMLLILSIASFIATLILMFKNRKEMTAFDQAKKNPFKKTEEQVDKSEKKKKVKENKKSKEKKDETDAEN